MTELTSILNVGEKAFERAIGFQDGRKYDEIVGTMKEVRSVGKGNKDYVLGLIQGNDKEIEKMSGIYGTNFISEYETERKRLIQQINGKKPN
jgi:hypothetical protein